MYVSYIKTLYYSTVFYLSISLTLLVCFKNLFSYSWKPGISSVDASNGQDLQPRDEVFRHNGVL